MDRYSNKKRITIGWITTQHFSWPDIYLLDRIRPDQQMRFRPVAEWINQHCSRFHNEIYNPFKRYDIVVFLKIMTDRALDEARKIRSYGGMIVFDANVNYYETWGEYPVPGTKPTEDHYKQAVWMTENADFVVADSAYIRDICMKFNKNAVWIPDNVDVASQYTGNKKHSAREKPVLIWSGQAKKAFHFELIEDCLYDYADRISLLIVTNKEFAGNPLPDVVHRMQKRLECEIRLWEASRYPSDLLEADVIISPKILNNSYEMGHSEYKITLGMAQRLPAIASDQRSYIDAFDGKQAGFICKDKKEWHDALDCLLASHSTRQEMGDTARSCVTSKYSIDVVSKQYCEVFDHLVSNSL